MITINNYFVEVNKIGIENLPETFKKSHELVNKVSSGGSNWSTYESNETIKRMIDLYFVKLTEYQKTLVKPEKKKEEQRVFVVKPDNWKKVENNPVVKKVKFLKPKYKVGEVFRSKPNSVFEEFEILNVYPPDHEYASPDSYFYLIKSTDFGEDNYSEESVTDYIKELKNKDVSTKASKTKKEAKQNEAKQNNAKLVERVDDEITLIKRYVNFHNKQKSRDQVWNLLKAVQKAILERRVNKKSTYGEEVMNIQDSLLKALKHDVKVFDIKIQAKQLENYTSIVTSVAPMTSIQLIKRYVGLQNKTGILEKAERLRDAIQKWYDTNVIKGDKYYKYLAHASNNLNDYIQQVFVLKNKNATLKTFTDAELNGLGLAGKVKSKEVHYISYLDSKNKFKETDKFFKGKNSFEAAVKWGRINLPNFNIDMVRMESLGSGKRTNVNKKYTHFAVNKNDGKIYTGWETITDVPTLKYYAAFDLNDMELNPKEFTILSKEYLVKKGVNPFDWENWKKTNLGFIPTMIAAAAGATVQAFTHHHLNKNKSNLSGKEPEVMSVSDARNETFKEIGLTGDYLKLIGRACAPTSIFIYGNGGSGKSGLSLKLADKLHQLNHSVLYAAGEQYGTPTFTELLKKVNISGGANFKIVKSLSTLPISNFDVIVIDSKESANLNKSSEFKQLRDTYPDKIWIITSQGLKSGEYKGDGQWLNEVETFIYCENGNASTIDEKNRWGGKAEIELFN